MAQRCELVCMPSVDNVERFASAAGDALAVTSPEKLKAFVLQAVKSLQSGDKALYGTVVGEASRFSKSLDQADLANVKTAGLQLLLATGIDAMPSALPNRQCHHVTCLSSRHPVNLVTSTRSDATSGGFLPPTNPSPPNKEIEDAAMKLADALYPLVSQLKSKEVGPLATKAVGLAITGNPTEIIRTIDAGLDAFITVPPAKVTSQLTCGG